MVKYIGVITTIINFVHMCFYTIVIYEFKYDPSMQMDQNENELFIDSYLYLIYRCFSLSTKSSYQ